MNGNTDPSLISRIRALSTPLEPRSTGAAPQLPSLSGIRAVVFDIYGTLVISASGDIGLAGERDEGQALASALTAVGRKASSSLQAEAPDVLKQVIRDHHEQRKAAGISYPEVDILAVWSETLARFDVHLAGRELGCLAVEYECRVNPVWPMPGLKDLLDKLRSQGLRLGIVSNAQFYTPLMLQAFLGCHPQAMGFNPDYCAWSYQALEAKPATRLYRQILTQLQDREDIDPQQVLYVGNDQLNDIWPADICGCKTALFAGDARSLRLREGDQRCAATQPSAVVTELHQITDLLGIDKENS